MKAALVFSLSIIVLNVQAWPQSKKPYDLYPRTANNNMNTITDCMHVASEAGDYIFKKSPNIVAANGDETVLEVNEAMTVCGLYVIGEPDTIVEITMKYYDVSCAEGALMAFVDGWELNGEYFPGIKDHHRVLEERVVEFCNSNKQWPRISNKKFFRSSQNAALLQYRIPIRGSFVANVHFHKITQPCNVLVHDTAAVYHMENFGRPRNCTISALFPSVVSLASIKVGAKNLNQQKANYACEGLSDRIEIGGSNGLDSLNMEKASEICGTSRDQGPEQAIFCGITTIRMLSSGRYQNQASVIIRKADESDFEIATLVCSL